MESVPAGILTMSLAAGWIANILVSMLTMGWPQRPTWVGAVAAFVFGVLAAFVVTLSELPSAAPIERQLIFTMFGAGILAAGAAMGIGAAQNAAEAKRAQTRPDTAPVTETEPPVQSAAPPRG